MYCFVKCNSQNSSLVAVIVAVAIATSLAIRCQINLTLFLIESVNRFNSPTVFYAVLGKNLVCNKQVAKCGIVARERDS